MWGEEEPLNWSDLWARRSQVLEDLEREFDLAEVSPSNEPRGRIMDELQKRLWLAD